MEKFDDLSQKGMQKRNKKKNITYQQRALDFLSYGFSYDNTEGILYSESCEREEAEKSILKALEKVPKSFSRHEYPPISFQDVIRKVKNTIINAPIEELEYYFNKYNKNDISNFINRIKEVRDSQFNIEKLLTEMEQYIDGLIVDNNAFAEYFEKDILGDANEKEMLEAKLFGVWPVFLIQRREKIDDGDKKILKLIEGCDEDIFYFLK